MDRKATLRQKRFEHSGVKLPKLREEEKKPTSKNPNDPTERLQKILANAGVCSRRKAEELILLGHVTVNGEVVNTLGAKANPKEDAIAVDGKVIETTFTQHVYYLMNKPRGYVTTTSDPQGRPTVMDLLGEIKQRVYPVGRLDYASEGLLLFTNDGELANKLMHPSSEVRRTYAVKLKGKVPESVLQTLRKGVQLSDGLVKPVKVYRGDHGRGKEWIHLEIKEGKNLEIRRVFALLELEIERLRRVAIGPLRIDAIPVGKFVPLTKRDVLAILDHAKEREKDSANDL